MDFRILGPLEVEDEGRLLKLGGAKQRALLALLLLRANEVVSRDRLIDELWGGSPPETASTALQVYVSQLRKALGADRVETRRPGYRLKVGSGELDLDRFEALVETARGQDPREAESGLREALGLWRGTPLADVDDALARPERARLEEQRLTVLERRIEAELALGHGSELVAELERLLVEHPLRERLRGQLMIALYRSGRQADALEVYRRGRLLLSEELGLEPDESLQRLEKAILRHDPSLNAVTTPADEPDARRHPVTVLPDSVVLIDAASQKVIETIRVGRRPVSITVGHGSVWVANADDGTVSRIDPDRREVVRTIGIGAPAVELAVGHDALWVANGSDGTVSRIDPTVDVVVETVDLRGSSTLAWNATYALHADSEAVWVGNGPHHVVRIDPANDQPTTTIDVGKVPVGVTGDGRAVWVATLGERAVRIEPGTNAPTVEMPIGYPVAVAAGAGAVWVLGREHVWRIDPDTASVAQVMSIGERLMGLCVAEGAVWAADNGAGTVTRIDPVRGRVTGSVMVGHAPTDVAERDGTIWASIQSERAM
jgi:YVTN family beta-propeller protein